MYQLSHVLFSDIDICNPFTGSGIIVQAQMTQIKTMWKHSLFSCLKSQLVSCNNNRKSCRDRYARLLTGAFLVLPKNTHVELSEPGITCHTYQISVKHPVCMEVMDSIEDLVEKGFNHRSWQLHGLFICFWGTVKLDNMLEIKQVETWRKLGDRWEGWVFWGILTTNTK